MRALLLLCLVGCRGPQMDPRPTPRPTPGSNEVAAKPNVDGPSERECDELFAHALAIVVAEKQPPPADAEALSRDLRPGFVADCRAGSRAYQQCGIAAKNAAELDGCKPR